MAKSDAEKKAYQKEYYQKYTKQKKKKGRKKGSKKKSSSQSLLGQNTSGLNDEGKMQATLIKEEFKKQMNEALAKAKTDEEKNQIRLDYSKRALAAIEKLKSDPKYAKPKTSKSKSSGSKSSGSKSSSGNKSGSKSGGTSNASKSSDQPVAKASVSIKSLSAETQKALDNINKKLSDLLSGNSISKLSDQERADLKVQLSGMINRIKRLKGI